MNLQVFKVIKEKKYIKNFNSSRGKFWIKKNAMQKKKEKKKLLIF